MNPAAVVLTGGASQRMGTDKATLIVEGRRLVDHTLAVVHAASIERVVIAGPDPGDLVDSVHDVAVVPDPVGPRQGPLGGVVNAWRHLTTSADPNDTQEPDPVLVVSCDLPWLTPTVLQAVVEAAGTHPHGAQAFDGERVQPLVAAYRSTTVERLVDAFDAGERSIRRILGDCNLALVPFDRAVLRDADEPADLDGVQVVWPDA